MLIRVIDPLWEGPRHDRLRACWDRVRAATDRNHDIEFVANHDGANHQTMLERCYRGSDPNRALVITEMDFLPAIADDWSTNVEKILEGFGGPVGVEYKMREAETFLLYGPRAIPGGWFLAFPEARPDADDIDFGGTDPANNAGEHFVHLLDGTDDFPGQTYPGIGHHLFWSRHYNDPEHAVAAGFPMSLVLPLTDKHIARWEKYGRV